MMNQINFVNYWNYALLIVIMYLTVLKELKDFVTLIKSFKYNLQNYLLHYIPKTKKKSSNTIHTKYV